MLRRTQRIDAALLSANTAQLGRNERRRNEVENTVGTPIGEHRHLLLGEQRQAAQAGTTAAAVISPIEIRPGFASCDRLSVLATLSPFSGCYPQRSRPSLTSTGRSREGWKAARMWRPDSLSSWQLFLRQGVMSEGRAFSRCRPAWSMDVSASSRSSAADHPAACRPYRG